MASAASAATVALCPAGPDEHRIEVTDDAARPGCLDTVVAMSAADIEWAEALPRPPRADEMVVVVVDERGRRRLELRPPESRTAPVAALPVGAPLLPRLTPRPYGGEGRVEAIRDNERLIVRCRSGTAPAGVVLAAEGARLPREAVYRVLARHDGIDNFRLSVVKADADAGNGIRLDAPNGRTALTPSPTAADGSVQFVVQCPDTTAQLQLDDLRLEPVRAPVPPARSAWAWQPVQWREAPDILIADAAARGIDRLHISLEISGGHVQHTAALGRFITAAAARGIGVDAVEGDPRMVRPAGRAAAVARARAIAHYQRHAAPNARLAGVQYDIEPYILPEFGAAPAALFMAWQATIRELADTLGRRVDVVVPFWVAESAEGRAALEGIADRTERLTVMAYRTDAALVTVIAEPLLAWGTRRGVPVRIALESGHLETETETRYQPSGQPGRLALLPVGEAAVVLKLRSGATSAGLTALAAVGTTRIAAERLSFLGDTGRLMATAAELGPPLSAWPSFAGFAFHGLY